MKIKFTVFGEAKPAGSKKGFPVKRKNGSTGVAIVDACKDTKSWQYVVSSAARDAYRGPLLDCALTMTLVFYFPRIAGHYGTGRNAGKLKPAAPAFLVKAPDVLKLSRAVEDALKNVVYTDDARIVQEHLFKNYGEPARVEVLIATLQ